MAELLQLPHEILHHILAESKAKDLAALSLTCRELRKLIAGNRLLWREVYYNHFDRPPAAQRSVLEDGDWERDLQEIMLMQSILQGDDVELKTKHFRMVGERVVKLACDALPHSGSSANVQFLSSLFKTEANREAFFCKSNLFHRLRYSARDKSGRIPPPVQASFEDRQLSAKMHSLYGVPIELLGRTRASRTYPYACSKVYDLRNYTRETMWGPFMEDGSGCVDWERVEAIIIVLGHNLNQFKHRAGIDPGPQWEREFEGCVPNSYCDRSGPRPEILSTSLDSKDPYNISGTWHRIVTFLDFTELFAFNFAFGQPAAGEPRSPLDTTEAIRLITMEIKVTKIEPPGPDDGQALPVVYFEGISKSMHSSWDPNANSGIRGYVKLTKEGEVRWTSFSIYQGEERWRSEGVQIGGPSSSRGVIGNWFDKDFDAHGPAGPTAYWKVSDEIPIIDSDDEMDIYGNFANQTDAAEGEGDDSDQGEEVTHQALLDMINHIHAHHGGGQGLHGILNGDGVFTGLNSVGINVEVVEETEEVEGQVGLMVHTHTSFANVTTTEEPNGESSANGQAIRVALAKEDVDADGPGPSS